MIDAITVRGGTDAASIVLFWPDNLPSDAEAALASDPVALLEKMRDQGKLVWFLCDGDGDYSLTIFVDRPIHDDLLPLCGDEETYPVLEVRGVGYFGGGEYAMETDARDIVGAMEQVHLPPGSYEARVYRTKLPSGLNQTWLAERAGRTAVRLRRVHRCFAVGAALCALCSLVMLCFSSWTSWLVLVCLAAFFAAVAFGMSRARWYRAVSLAQEEYEAKYPSYVLHLTTRGEGLADRVNTP